MVYSLSKSLKINYFVSIKLLTRNHYYHYFIFYVGIKKKEQMGSAVEFWAAKKEILYTNKRAE